MTDPYIAETVDFAHAPNGYDVEIRLETRHGTVRALARFSPGSALMAAERLRELAMDHGGYDPLPIGCVEPDEDEEA